MDKEMQECSPHVNWTELQRAENCATKICHQTPSHGRAAASKVSLKKKISFIQTRNVLSYCTSEYLNYYYY